MIYFYISYISKTEDSSVKKVTLLFILQVSGVCGLIGEIWTLTSASAFIPLPSTGLVEADEEMGLPKNMSLEKGGVS